MRVGRIIGGLVGAAATGGAAIFGATGGFDDDTTRNESGEITEAGGVGVFVLDIGDCIQLPDGLTAVSIEGVPCDEPHNGQVYAEFDIEEATLPVPADLDELAAQGCEFNWAPALGAAYEAMPDHDMTWFVPTKESWDQANDREVQCIVMRIDKTEWTGSLLSEQ